MRLVTTASWRACKPPQGVLRNTESVKKRHGCLTLTGEESIAHTLFSEPERISGGVPSQFLELLDFMISFRFTQCDTERLGRTMTLTKPALRSVPW